MSTLGDALREAYENASPQVREQFDRAIGRTPVPEDNPAGEGTPIPGWPDQHMLEAAMGLLVNAVAFDPASGFDEAKRRWMDAYHTRLTARTADAEQTGAQRMVVQAIADARAQYPADGQPATAAWEQWWRQQAENAINMMRPKVTGYGARDLEQIGRTTAEIIGREVDTQNATLLGIHFYLVGKLARWTEALREGREVSHDTLLDLGVYALMALRTHECGSWPGPDKEDQT